MRRYATAGLFLATALLFGTAFAAIEVGLTVLPPVLFAALRFDVGALVLLGVVAVRGGYWRPLTGADYRAVVVSAVFLVSLNAVLLFVGQQYTTSGAAAVMFSLAPVLSPLFARFLLPDERISAVGALGVLLGLIGVVIVVAPDPSRLLAAGAVGQALVAVAAVSVAFGSVLLRRIDPGVGSLAMTAWAMALSAALVHVASLALGESPAAVAWTPVALGAVAYLGLFSTAGAFPAYFALIERVGPIRANLVTYAVPVVAAIAGALVLDERIAASTALGFAVVVLGFGLVERDVLAEEFALVRARLGRPADADEADD
ncbi:DMT family transporter [Halomarina pelagica]|uniref:DMT family transporter n=1 Tax=Halomarina pelagica TaxID=2961599 RepID=UPI0020C58F2A|nr:EamA family transporter [Halomarina sp. BND7]